MLGTFSTAGFGAFVVALAIGWLFPGSNRKYPLRSNVGFHYFRDLFKLACLGLALWVAVYSPYFGLISKQSYNAASLDERRVRTQAGIDAILSAPFGTRTSQANEAINLIAAIAPFGLPFPFIVVSALVLPRIIGRGFVHGTAAPIFAIFATLLLSQPALDSTFIFVLIALVYELASPPHAGPQARV
jgi:hypothetical protein